METGSLGIGVQPFGESTESLCEPIMIAPPSWARRIPGAMRTFNSLHEFDQWRRQALSAPFTVAAVIAEALAAIDADVRQFDPEVRTALTRLGECFSVPNLKWLLLNADMPRRTFYRRWNADIPEYPHRFLLRLRVLHADRLIDRGSTAKQASAAAGFKSCIDYRTTRQSFEI